MTHKQWLYRNNNVHYVSEGFTLRQHKELTAKIKVLMKTKCSALLGRHQHYMSTNFDELGCGPTLARQVSFANIEMAISIANVVEGISAHMKPYNNCIPHLPFLPPNHHHRFLSLTLAFALLHTYTIRHSPYLGDTHATLSYPRLRIQDHTPPAAHRPHLTTLPCSVSS